MTSTVRFYPGPLQGGENGKITQGCNAGVWPCRGGNAEPKQEPTTQQGKVIDS